MHPWCPECGRLFKCTCEIRQLEDQMRAPWGTRLPKGYTTNPDTCLVEVWDGVLHEHDGSWSGTWILCKDVMQDSTRCEYHRHPFSHPPDNQRPKKN